jgi:hypothetical protein
MLSLLGNSSHRYHPLQKFAYNPPICLRTENFGCCLPLVARGKLVDVEVDNAKMFHHEKCVDTDNTKSRTRGENIQPSLFWRLLCS